MTAPKINLSREQRQGVADTRSKLTAEEVDRLIACLERASRQIGEAIEILGEEARARGLSAA